MANILESKDITQNILISYRNNPCTTPLWKDVTMKERTLHILFIQLIGGLMLSAQSLTVPNLLSLEQSLEKFHTIELQAQLKALERTKSAGWKDLLPSVGVAYTPSGAPRPAANWSPLQILDRKEKEHKRKLDRESLILSYQMLLTERLYKLRQIYYDYEIDRKSLINDQAGAEIDQEIFAITERKYQENLIKPSEYLSAKKALHMTNSTLQQQEEELYKKRNALMYEARWEN